MAKKTAKVGRSCCKSTVRLGDTHSGLIRVRAVLAKLSDHEANVNGRDDEGDVFAVRFALLDAACDEVASLLKASAA